MFGRLPLVRERKFYALFDGLDASAGIRTDGANESETRFFLFFLLLAGVR